MKKIAKWSMFLTFAGPVLYGSSCAVGLREALIEGGFAFVEETTVETLNTLIPVGNLLEGEHAKEEGGKK